MLIRFSVENFLSFGKKQEFNLLTGSQRRFPNHVLSVNGIDVLKVAAIYGANGAGKSNLIKAMRFLDVVLFKGEIADDYSLNRNKLTKKDGDPISFSVECKSKSDDVFYYYTLSFVGSRIIEESLYITGSNAPIPVFSRKQSLEGDSKPEIIIDPKYRPTTDDEIVLSGIQIKPNELAISELGNYSGSWSSIIRGVYGAIDFGMYSESVEQEFSNYLMIFERNPSLFKSAKEFICCAHTGIADIELKEMPAKDFLGAVNIGRLSSITDRLRYSKFHSEYDATLKENILYFKKQDSGEVYARRLIPYHKNSLEELVPFDLKMESDGSKKYVELVPRLLELCVSTRILIIDEIENSIHPSLLKELLSKLLSSDIFKGQLIFTTHESNLLDLDIFRQDEFWFAEKDKDGDTNLYSLSDYATVRSDLDLQKGYLNGRFGAVPFLANLQDLKWQENVASDSNI
jgi:AAA15 family ATPase/GTPase